MFKIPTTPIGLDNQDYGYPSEDFKDITIKIGDTEATADVIWGARGFSRTAPVTRNTVRTLYDGIAYTSTSAGERTATLTVIAAEVTRWYKKDTTLRGFTLTDFQPFTLIELRKVGDENGAPLIFKTVYYGCQFTDDNKSYSQGTTPTEITLNMTFKNFTSNTNKEATLTTADLIYV